MSAVISECGLYRYLLQREWIGGYGRALFVMLNPSTADATQDDPTIGRCIGFAKSWGCAGLEVVNLYAFRATKPADMFAAADAIGPANDSHIRAAANRAKLIVAAWGANAKRDRAVAVLSLLSDHAIRALGTTKGGYPRHPLFVRGDAKLIPFGVSP
jgi:hypothetical protein